MDMNAYHRALMQGFSEREAARIGEDAYEDGILSSRRRQYEPEPEPPLCGICGEFPSVADSAGYGVCSEACSNEAISRGTVFNNKEGGE